MQALSTRGYNDMGLVLFQLKNDSQGAMSLEFQHYMEPAMERVNQIECTLGEGTYIIVPRSFGYGFANDFTENPIVPLLLENGELSNEMSRVIRDLYLKYTCGSPHYSSIEYKEFKPIYDRMILPS